MFEALGRWGGVRDKRSFGFIVLDGLWFFDHVTSRRCGDLGSAKPQPDLGIFACGACVWRALRWLLLLCMALASSNLFDPSPVK